jgi:hypothetical protein
MELTRRSFVSGAAATGTAVAAAAMVTGTAGTAVADEAGQTVTGPKNHGNQEQPGAGCTITIPTEAGHRYNGAPAHTEGYEITLPGAMPIAPENAADVEFDEECEILVVGMGGGGLNAACYAAEAGAKVIAIEKSNITGGATRHAAIWHCKAGGSQAQQDMDYAWPDNEVYSVRGEEWNGRKNFNPDIATEFTEQKYQYTINPQLLRQHIIMNAECADWMMEHEGVNWGCSGTVFVDEEVYNYEYNTVLGEDNTCNAIEACATAAGADIRCYTECTGFVVNDEGRVEGIKCHDGMEDRDYYIKGTKGIILDAGGFGYNLDMLKKYIPLAYEVCTQGGPFPTHTGEVTRMCLGVGADMAGFNSFSGWDGGLDEYWGNGDGAWWHYFWGAGTNLIQNPWLCIDEAGQRIQFLFCDQDSEKGSVTPGFYDDPVGNGDMDTISGLLSAVGHRGIRIFDDKYEESIYKFWEVYSQYKAYDGNRTPIPNPYDDRKTKETGLFNDQDWKAEFEEFVERGAITRCDTLEELEDALNLRRGVIVDAVAHWNELCEAGEDDDELPVKYRPEYLIPIDTPPYYAAKVSSRLAKTCCGVRVDPNNQVMRDDGSLIENLYACFTTAGGLGGENMISGWGNYTISGSQAGSWVSGYNAAKAILG